MLSLLILVLVSIITTLIIAPLFWTIKNRQPVPFLQQYKEGTLSIIKGIWKDTYDNIEFIIIVVVVIVVFIMLKKYNLV